MGYFDPENHDTSKGELNILPGKEFKWPGITLLTIDIPLTKREAHGP